jgi:hypothetical protein
MKPEAQEVSPRKVLAQVAAAIPPDVHPNIVIIGSLAAGYWLFQGDESFAVRTKDIDCVLSPHLSAVEKGRAVAEKLLAAIGNRILPATSRSPAKLAIQKTNFPLFGFIRQAAASGLLNCSPSQPRKIKPHGCGLDCHSRPATSTHCRVFNLPALPLSRHKLLNLEFVARDLK